MYNEKIDAMIMAAVKEAGASTVAEEKELLKSKAGVYRLIKAEFLSFKTAKNAKPLDEAAEIAILRKMIKQREESAATYRNAGREELAVSEETEIKFLKELLPAEITSEQIEAAVKEVIGSGVEPNRKNMGAFMAAIGKKYPTADKKLVSSIVMKFLS